MSAPPPVTSGRRDPLLSAVLRRAVLDALAMPAIMLVASMTGFGSLARDSGLTLGAALASTAGVWGLPGQIAFAELYAGGSEALAVVMAVSLANARFLPMAVAFVPLLRVGLKRQAWVYGLVQLMSINTWAAGLREFPGLSGPHRRAYYLLFAAICLAAGLAGTATGFYATAALPRPVALGLLFVNPLFFALLFADARGRGVIAALLIGAVVGPLFHLLSPDWGLLATGLVAGTAAFWLSRLRFKGRAG